MKKVYQPQNRKSYVVKRAIKRELVRGIIGAFILSFVLLFTTFLVQNSAVLSLVFAIAGLLMFAVSMILFFKINRCPYCGRLFKGLHWSKPDAGLCLGCGKLIQYTDKKQANAKMQFRQQKQKK